MPRTPRLIEDNSYYHIITRGNDRKGLFRYRQDFQYFLRLANETQSKNKKDNIINNEIRDRHLF